MGASTTEVALVTGGTGFIGSRLVSQLLGGRWRVHVIVRPASKVHVLAQQSVELHTYDGSVESLLEAVGKSRPDVVFHLAALSLAQHTPQQVASLIESNVLFGAHLLEAVVRQAPQSRFVNVGSFWQHYQGKTYSPTSLYAATKQAFEDILIYYVEAFSLRALTLVLFDVYGPNDPRPRLLNLLRKAALEGNALPVSPGEQLLDLVHVDDVAGALIQAAHWLRDEATAGYARFAISSGRLVSLRDLVALCEQVTGHPIPVIWGGRPYRSREVMEPWRGGALLPGWQPQITLEEGVAQIFAQN